jgi:hypothetical protein
MARKPNKLCKSILIAYSTALLVGCDGSSPEEELADEFPDTIERGLNISDITNNPTDAPGFPSTLLPGESITFLPVDDLFFTDFLEDAPLGTWTVESSGFLRQGADSTGDIYFPAGQDTFTYEYRADSIDTDTSSLANLSYTDNFEFTDAEFDSRVSIVANSSNEPGSLGFTLENARNEDFFDFFTDFFDEETDGVSPIQRIYIDGVSSVGFAAISTSVFDISTEQDAIFVRRSRDISMSEITSQNADLAGSAPFITGRYRVEEVWEETSNINGNLSINFGGRVIVRGIQEGTFIIRLNQLTD